MKNTCKIIYTRLPARKSTKRGKEVYDLACLMAGMGEEFAPWSEKEEIEEAVIIGKIKDFPTKETFINAIKQDMYQNEEMRILPKKRKPRISVRNLLIFGELGDYWCYWIEEHRDELDELY